MTEQGKFEVLVGSPHPMGASQVEQGFNFAVYAPDANKLFIYLTCPDTEEVMGTVELTNRTGKVFHGLIKGVKANWNYAIQVQAKSEVKNSELEHKLLLDPYAKAFDRSLVWQSNLYQHESPFFMPKAQLTTAPFDWQNVTKPKIPVSETVLYETHVKGFTKRFSKIDPAIQGTYLGLAQSEVIDYIKQLGVTSVQLMPVFYFMSEPRLEELGLTNYWGYNPINFFAPDPRYAAYHCAVTEFKTLVRELHKNGLEVILDVVYNHTAEGGVDGPILSFKGLVEHEFYLREEDSYTFDYANYTGCGNTVNTDSDYSIKLILDSLRYWITEMQVDGFRFDLAATLGRNGDRFNSRATLLRAMKQDPIISQAKLIAEPWDIGPEGYQLGNFPSNWLECNDKYRDGLRRFWRGDRGLVADTATRILGSRDVFKKGKRSPTSSVNYISYHDGFTLNDIVSYNDRHNLKNLENNRDGHGANFSHNHGVEGPTSDVFTAALREKQKRNMMATLLFSQGVPHLLAGDEIGRTQQGNNNAYCQDNEISWVDWHLDRYKHELLAFTQYCIKLRKAYPVLQTCLLADDNYQHSDKHHHVNWIRPDGEEKNIDDWHNHDNQCLGLLIADDDKQYQMLLILNASQDVHDYRLPKSSKVSLLLDTSQVNVLSSRTWSDQEYPQQPQSLSLWQLDY